MTLQLSHKNINLAFYIGIWLTTSVLTSISIMQWCLSPISPLPVWHISFFFFFLVIAIYHPTASVCIFIFICPSLIDLNKQISAIFPNFHFMVSNLLFIDMINGLNLGILISLFLRKKTCKINLIENNNLNILRLILVIFVGHEILFSLLTILKNINQSASSLSVTGLFWNLTNASILGWFHDYLPLKQILFTTSICTILIIISIVLDEARFLKWLTAAITVSIGSVILYGYFTRIYDFGFYQYMPGRTWGINGYLPDIHAFSTIAAAATLSSFFSFLYKDQMRIKIAAAGFLFISSLALIFSGSRSTLAVVFLVMIYTSLIHLPKLLRERSPRNFFSNAVLVFAILVFITFTVHYGVSRTSFSYAINMIYQGGLSAIDKALSYRPGIYIAAILLWSSYPIFGVGINSFFRLSSDADIIPNTYLNTSGGENVHSYFLQILVEKGLIGILFILALLYITLRKARLSDEPLLLGLFIGIISSNLFAHSLLLPNIWFLFGLISFVIAIRLKSEKIYLNDRILGKAKKIALYCSSPLLAMIALTYVTSDSAKDNPFSYGRICYKDANHSDGFVGGIYKKELTRTGKVLRIELKPDHVDIQKRPLETTFDIIYNGNNVHHKKYFFTSHDHHTIDIQLNSIPKNENFIFTMKASRCFIPMNLGVNLDSRRLGVRLYQASVINL